MTGLMPLTKDSISYNLSIRYYNMMDVWDNATAGMLDKTNGEIAQAALGRWKRCSNITRP
jgi:hypothetical protein